MLTIVTALRAKALASNWDHHVSLLERSLTSMLSNVGNMRIVVICHDVPRALAGSDKRVTFLPIHFDVPKRLNDDMCVDKVLKLSVGTRWALERGTDYVMFSDADDLVNRRTVSLVEQSRGEPGWYSNIEYYCTYGARHCHVNKVAPGTSGSSVIMRSDLLEFDRPPFRRKWTDLVSRDEQPYLDLLAMRQHEVSVLAAVGHPDYVRLLALDGHKLQPFPFAANLKIRHYDGTSLVAGGKGCVIFNDPRPTWRRLSSLIKKSIGDLSRMRPITRNIKLDFSL